jgi:hypothetical protein
MPNSPVAQAATRIQQGVITANFDRQENFVMPAQCRIGVCPFTVYDSRWFDVESFNNGASVKIGRSRYPPLTISS